GEAAATCAHSFLNQVFWTSSSTADVLGLRVRRGRRTRCKDIQPLIAAQTEFERDSAASLHRVENEVAAGVCVVDRCKEALEIVVYLVGQRTRRGIANLVAGGHAKGLHTYRRRIDGTSVRDRTST